MRRITKWVAAGVVAVAGAAFFAPAADAAGPDGFGGGSYHPGGPNRDSDFVVFVRHGHHGEWRFHGRYETYQQAHHAESRLERQGYQVRISTVRVDDHDRGPGRPW